MLLRKCLPIVLAILLLIAFSPLPVQAAGAVYYVAKNGSDSNPGTEALPWLTIQKAVNSMSAGDTTLVKAGTYAEEVRIVSKPANMTLKAFPGDSPIIDGFGRVGFYEGIIYVRNTDYLTLDGFELYRTTPGASGGGYGLCVDRDVDHLTAKNLKIHSINRGGMYFAGVFDQNSVESPTGTVTNLLVDGCDVYDTNMIIASNELCSLIRVNGFELKNSKFHESGLNSL